MQRMTHRKNSYKRWSVSFRYLKCFGQLEIFELHSFIILLWFCQKCVCNSQHTYVLYVYVFLICVFFGLPGSASSHSGRLDARLPRSRQEPAAVSAHDVSPTAAEEDAWRCAKTYKKRFLKLQFHGFALLLYGCKDFTHLTSSSLHFVICFVSRVLLSQWLQRQVLERIWAAWRWTRASLLFA